MNVTSAKNETKITKTVIHALERFREFSNWGEARLSESRRDSTESKTRIKRDTTEVRPTYSTINLLFRPNTIFGEVTKLVISIPSHFSQRYLNRDSSAKIGDIERLKLRLITSTIPNNPERFTLMEIMAIVTDVDGTITDARSRLELNAVKEIRRLESMKYQVIISSGRTFCQIAALSVYLGTSGVLICENGGVVGFKNGDIRTIGKRENAEAGLKILREKLGDLIEIKGFRSMYRIIDIALERNFPAEVGNMILREQQVPAHILDSGVALHLVDRRVNKGRGLRKACQMIKLKPANVATVGDNLNDVDMFKIAGYSIALGNAPEEAKRSSNYTCKAEYGKGFREGIAHLFKEGILKKI